MFELKKQSCGSCLDCSYNKWKTNFATLFDWTLWEFPFPHWFRTQTSFPTNIYWVSVTVKIKFSCFCFFETFSLFHWHIWTSLGMDNHNSKLLIMVWNVELCRLKRTVFTVLTQDKHVRRQGGRAIEFGSGIAIGDGITIAIGRGFAIVIGGGFMIVLQIRDWRRIHDRNQR